MAADQTAGAILIAATAASYTGLAPLGFALGDFGWATAAVALGSFCGTCLSVKADWEKASLKSPGYYIGTGAMGMLASPLIGGVALAAVRASGFIPDAVAIPVLMAFGYAGKPALDLIVGIAKSGISARVGNKSGGES